MVQVCKANDIPIIIDYIGNRHYECLYLYLDLVNYGVSCDYVTTWALKSSGQLRAVVLKYKTGMHIFSQDNDFDIDELTQLLLSHSPGMICSTRSIISLLSAKFLCKSYNIEYGYVGHLNRNKKTGNSLFVEKANKIDFGEIVSLLYQDEGIGASYDKRNLAQQMYERNRQGYTRNLVIKEDNHVISHICTGAELDNIAVVSGLVTDKNYRGKGYASSLIQACCNQLVNEGKEVYSIYYTPTARQTHHKAGFRDLCECGKLYLKTH